MNLRALKFTVIVAVSGCAGRSWVRIPEDARPISVQEAITRVQKEKEQDPKIVTVTGIATSLSSSRRFTLQDEMDATKHMTIDNSAPETRKVETAGRWVTVHGRLRRDSGQIVLQAQAVEIGEAVPRQEPERNHQSPMPASGGGHHH